MKRFTRFLTAGISLLALASASFAQSAKPAELKLGMSTFMTGPASVLGTPAKIAADMWIEDFNAAGGIDGVKLKPTWID